MGPKLIVSAGTIIFALVLNVIFPQGLAPLIIKIIMSVVIYFLFMNLLSKSDMHEFFRLILNWTHLKRT